MFSNSLLSIATSESVQDNIPFSEAEVERFKERYAEGYDLTADTHYNQWLQMAHPDDAILAQLPIVSQGTVVPFQPGMTTFSRPTGSVGQLSRFLKQPTPATRKFTRSKTSSRVLTSAESLKIMELKENEKKEKEAAKEQRKRAVEERKRIRDEKKKQTELEKEKKAAPQASKKQDKRRNPRKGSTPAASV